MHASNPINLGEKVTHPDTVGARNGDRVVIRDPSTLNKGHRRAAAARGPQALDGVAEDVILSDTLDVIDGVPAVGVLALAARGGQGAA